MNILKHTSTLHLLFLNCFSGLPVLIVGITLAISVDKYKAEDHCWLNVKTDTIWAFVGPVIFVLAVCCVCVLTCHNLLHWLIFKRFQEVKGNDETIITIV